MADFDDFDIETQNNRGDNSITVANQVSVVSDLDPSLKDNDRIKVDIGNAAVVGPQGPQGDPGPSGFGVYAFANVSSIGVISKGRGLLVSKTSVGTYLYTFTTPTPDVNYIVSTGFENLGTNTDTNWFVNNKTVSGFTLTTGIGDNGTAPDTLQDTNHSVTILGDAGPQGITSAYQSWLDVGNVGTEQDFLNTITGPQGPQGLTGSQGPQGQQGIQGPTGPQGPQGDVGDTGPQGIQGLTGPQGIQGIQGPQGVKGDQGDPFTISQVYVSIAAMNADVGNQSEGAFVFIDTGNVNDVDTGKLFQKVSGVFVFITDLSGAQGIQGPKGDTGDVGPQGTQGPIGNTGPQGPQGDPGPQGLQGIQGDTGPQGVEGPQGIQGNTGPIGPQGLQGVQGATGPQGTQGERGSLWFNGSGVPPAALGQDFDQYIDNLTFDYYIKSASTWTLQGNFVGPQGPTGAEGPQGPEGPTGPQGPAGPTNVFGSDFQGAVVSNLGQTNSTTPVQRVSLSVTIANTGTYKIGWFYNWAQSSSSNDFRAEIRRDAFVINYHSQEPKDPGTDQVIPASGFDNAFLAAGTYEFSIWYWAESNTSYIRDAKLEFWRLS